MALGRLGKLVAPLAIASLAACAIGPKNSEKTVVGAMTCGTNLGTSDEASITMFQEAGSWRLVVGGTEVTGPDIMPDGTTIDDPSYAGILDDLPYGKEFRRTYSIKDPNNPKSKPTTFEVQAGVSGDYDAEVIITSEEMTNVAGYSTLGASLKAHEDGEVFAETRGEAGDELTVDITSSLVDPRHSEGTLGEGLDSTHYYSLKPGDDLLVRSKVEKAQPNIPTAYCETALRVVLADDRDTASFRESPAIF